MNDIDTGRAAALAALVLRRFPPASCTVRLRCLDCAATAAAHLDTAATGAALLSVAAALGHACADPDLLAWCDNDLERHLRWEHRERTVVEPSDDRRWAGDHGATLLAAAEAEIAGDPARPVVSLRLTAPDADTGITRPTAGPLPTSIHAAFHDQVVRTPDRVAVRTERGTLSYRELADQAARVAAAVRAESGHGPVAVDLDLAGPYHEPAVLLGILAAGRSYLALDRRSPVARQRQIIELAAPALLISDRPGELALPMLRPGELCQGAAVTEPDWSAGNRTDPAYLVFTSGSTGVPKGVVIPHEAVLRLSTSDILPADVKAGRFLRAAPLAFDASTFELWLPLLHGGAVVPVDGMATDLDRLAARLRQEAVDVAWCTAGLFHQVCDVDPAVFDPLTWLFVGGDVVRPDRVAALLGRGGIRVVNGYGPTENTTFTTTFTVPDAATALGCRRLPIGVGVSGDVLRVLDAGGRPVAAGLAGELTVAGAGVALGYLGDPVGAADRFGEFGGLRGYRTGDFVAVLADGTLDFLGRVDGQAKHRGFRVELGEIESAMTALPSIRHASITLDRVSAGAEPTLLAAVVPADAADCDVAMVRRQLAAALPDYMVPDHMVLVAGLPLGSSGKVDRKRIAELVRAADTPDTDHADDPVRAAVETVLGRRDFTDRDRLLEYGLHSLQAFRLLRELRPLCATLQLREVLSNASVAGLRAAVKGVSA